MSGKQRTKIAPLQPQTVEEYAYVSYEAVCGNGSAAGDGVVPIESAHLNDAVQVCLLLYVKILVLFYFRWQRLMFIFIFIRLSIIRLNYVMFIIPLIARGIGTDLIGLLTNGCPLFLISYKISTVLVAPR